MRKVLVQQECFDVGEEYAQLLKLTRQTGAVAMFVGAVRDLNEGDEVKGLWLEHYPGMTEQEISRIIEAAAVRWPLLGATVIHRVGQLQPGEAIVFVGIASQHRACAFAACDYVMDFLKTRATFWKKELTPAGDRWLETRESDLVACQAWDESSKGPPGPTGNEGISDQAQLSRLAEN